MTDEVEMVKYAQYDEGGRILYVGEVPEAMISLQGERVYKGEANYLTQYVDVLTGRLMTYTPAEQFAKDHLPAGWVWHMPQRVALDLRSPKERHEQNILSCQLARGRAYPPLKDFADAMYWQSKGDDGPMKAYLAACDKVKKDFPKP